MAVVEKLTPKKDPVWQTRVDLAAAYQLSAKMGMTEGIDNHFTVRVPGTTDKFFINPKGLHWAEITALDVLMCDYEGNVLEGEHAPPKSGPCIHFPIHKLHPRGGAVFHTHMPWSTAIAAVKGGRVEMVHQNAMRFYDDIAYDHEFNGLAMTHDEGERMGAIMKDKGVLFLENHGVITVAESVGEAFDMMYFIERTCQVQVLAQSMGKPLAICRQPMVEETRETFKNFRINAVRHFEALKRVYLDREGSDYAS
ncbi:MAG: class II aldolase/adducin family protein [Alphaproteobacteria bacterium]